MRKPHLIIASTKNQEVLQYTVWAHDSNEAKIMFDTAMERRYNGASPWRANLCFDASEMRQEAYMLENLHKNECKVQ